MSYPSFYNNINNSFIHIQDILVDAVNNRYSPFRTMNIGYINDNVPMSRVVVLRHCETDLSFLQFHTDYRSPKIKALTKNHFISALFYDHTTKLQLSINGKAQIHYKDTVAEKAWEKTQILSRRCYLSLNPPSTLIPEADAGFDSKFMNNTQTLAETEAGYDNFAVVRIYINQIDWLYLHAHGNRRIIFTPSNKGFDGQWYAP